MSKLRLLFVKESQASYISHLDLMRTFQRCFPRTELEIKHTQGYHPHPIISIVLPLPVGQSSDCELLDFEVTQASDGSGIAEKLNTGMPTGIRVLDCYEAKRPIRELDSGVLRCGNRKGPAWRCHFRFSGDGDIHPRLRRGAVSGEADGDCIGAFRSLLEVGCGYENMQKQKLTGENT